MHRRLFLVVLGSFPLVASSQPLVAAVVLLEVAKALGEAGDALSKITKGFRDLVVAGHEGYSYVAAKRERDRLVDLNARLTQLREQKQVVVVRGIEDYIRYVETGSVDVARLGLDRDQAGVDRLALGLDPSVGRVWKGITDNIAIALKGVKELLDEIKKERSDFVLEESYAEIMRSLSSRVTLLDRLKGLAPPVDKEELSALRAVNESYQSLLDAQYEAIKEMSAYIRKLKK